MSTHNICFHGDIRKIFIWISLLSRTVDCLQTSECSDECFFYFSIHAISSEKVSSIQKALIHIIL